MKETFALFDIPKLMNAFKCSSALNDLLPGFLSRYDLDRIDETEDGSTVFETLCGGYISIEFFNFSDPLSRSVSIPYEEGGDFKIFSHEFLMRIA